MTISLSGIPGIGPSTARVLMENGFKSANEIAQASIAQLVGVPGFSTARASRTIKAANELLSASAHAANSTTQPAPSQGRAAKIPVPKSPTDTTADNDTKETEIKKVTKKEPEELEKAKAKEAKKAKKAKKAEKAEKAAEKKAEKAKKAAAEKAKKVAAKKARTAKKAAKKKAKASAKKSRK